MAQSNRYLKDKDNRTIIPYTSASTVLFEDKLNLVNKLSILTKELTTILKNKVDSDTYQTTIRNLNTIIESKLDKTIYLTDLSDIILRLTELENNDNGGGGSVIPPDLENTIIELRQYIEELQEKVIYSSNIPSTVSVGGIEEGYVSDGIDITKLVFKLLHPVVDPVYSIKQNPSDSLVEIGSSLSFVRITLNINPKSSPISRVDLLIDGSITQTRNFSDNSLINHILTFDLSNLRKDTSYSFKITDSDGYIITSSKNISFINPIYVGSVEEDVTTGILSSLTKRVVNPSMQSYTYTLANKKMCIVIPDNWSLVKILDLNSFDITNTFTKKLIVINSKQYSSYVSNKITLHNYTVRYYCEVK